MACAWCSDGGVAMYTRSMSGESTRASGPRASVRNSSAARRAAAGSRSATAPTTTPGSWRYWAIENLAKAPQPMRPTRIVRMPEAPGATGCGWVVRAVAEADEAEDMAELPTDAYGTSLQGSGPSGRVAPLLPQACYAATLRPGQPAAFACPSGEPVLHDHLGQGQLATARFTATDIPSPTNADHGCPCGQPSITRRATALRQVEKLPPQHKLAYGSRSPPGPSDPGRPLRVCVPSHHVCEKTLDGLTDAIKQYSRQGSNL